MRDAQVPFVNEKNGDKAANAHWTALYHFSQIPHHLIKPAAISARNIEDFSMIRERYEYILLSGNNRLNKSNGQIWIRLFSVIRLNFNRG